MATEELGEGDPDFDAWGIPRSKRGWSQWLVNNEQEFRTKMQEVRAGSRKKHTQRVSSQPNLVRARLNPRQRNLDNHANGWINAVRDGFYALRRVDPVTEIQEVVVLLAVTFTREHWCLMLREEGNRGFLLPRPAALQGELRPLLHALPPSFVVAQTIEVVKLSMSVRGDLGADLPILVCPTSATTIPPPVRGHRQKRNDNQNLSSDEEFDLESAMSDDADQFSVMSASEEEVDVDSLVSYLLAPCLTIFEPQWPLFS